VYQFSVESGKETPVWASNTDGKNGKHLILQEDGNLVIYDEQNKPVWTPNTYGKGVVKAVMQDDGNFVLYTKENKPIWCSKTGNC
jgi:hypothetical protein